MNIKFDLIGKKIGHLKVLRFLRSANRTTYWECICDCGNVVEKTRFSIGKKQPTKSCSRKCKVGSSKRLPPGEASFNTIYRRYKRNAKSKSIEFNLSIEIFKFLTQQICHYCGLKPTNVFKDRCSYSSYTYNGLDRIDNSKGYIIDNIVTCCEQCNRMKLDYSREEFLSQVTRIFKFYGLQNN